MAMCPAPGRYSTSESRRYPNGCVVFHLAAGFELVIGLAVPAPHVWFRLALVSAQTPGRRRRRHDSEVALSAVLNKYTVKVHDDRALGMKYPARDDIGMTFRNQMVHDDPVSSSQIKHCASPFTAATDR